MIMTTTPRPYIPDTEGLNREFFQRAAGGILHLQRCADCSHFRFPPRNYCARCHSGAWDWIPSPAVGALASWVTSHFSLDPGWVDCVPYTTAVVELDEGPRLLGAIRDIKPDDFRIGLPVALVLERLRDDYVFFWVERRQ